MFATGLLDYVMYFIVLLNYWSVVWKPSVLSKKSFFLQPFLYLLSCSFLFAFLRLCSSDHTSCRKVGIFPDLPGHIRPNQKSSGRHQAAAFQRLCYTHSSVVLMSACESHVILLSSVNCCWFPNHCWCWSPSQQSADGLRNPGWVTYRRTHTHTHNKVSSLSNVQDLTWSNWFDSDLNAVSFELFNCLDGQISGFFLWMTQWRFFF